MRTHSRRLTRTAALVALAAGTTAFAPADARAQDGTLARRVDAVRDGEVRMEYATRDGSCGDGRSLVALGRMFHSVSMEGMGTLRGTTCLPGLARVTVTRREGRVTAVRQSIGGAWPAAAGGTMLGRVPAADAAAYFTAVARAAEGRAARGALWAAAIADSARPARDFLGLAQDASRPWTARRTALQLAGPTGDAALAPELERLARAGTAEDGGRKKDEGDLSRAAVSALAMLPGDAGLEAVLRLAREAPSPRVREAAVFHLAQHEDPRGPRAARQVVEDGAQPERVRASALHGLLARDDAGPEERRWARALWPRLASDRLRDAALMGIAQHGTDDDRRWVLGLARDESLPVEARRKAVFWAGQGGAPVAELLEAYRAVREAKVREHVIFALSQREGEAATDALIGIARGDADREMRRKAVFWLGQRRDARATQAITDMINQ